jgi:hypothetical protein
MTATGFIAPEVPGTAQPTQARSPGLVIALIVGLLMIAAGAGIIVFGRSPPPLTGPSTGTSLTTAFDSVDLAPVLPGWHQSSPSPGSDQTSSAVIRRDEAKLPSDCGSFVRWSLSAFPGPSKTAFFSSGSRIVTETLVLAPSRSAADADAANYASPHVPTCLAGLENLDSKFKSKPSAAVVTSVPSQLTCRAFETQLGSTTWSLNEIVTAGRLEIYVSMKGGWGGTAPPQLGSVNAFVGTQALKLAKS